MQIDWDLLKRIRKMSKTVTLLGNTLQETAVKPDSIFNIDVVKHKYAKRCICYTNRNI